eukprot:1151445-Pelagomonas_calceolata.AAC.2
MSARCIKFDTKQVAVMSMLVRTCWSSAMHNTYAPRDTRKSKCTLTWLLPELQPAQQMTWQREVCSGEAGGTGCGVRAGDGGVAAISLQTLQRSRSLSWRALKF